MIATHSLQSLNRIISKATTCNSSSYLQWINFCQRALLLSNSKFGKIIITRNLCTNQSKLLEAKDTYFDKSDEFGNLKVPLEKIYKSNNRQKITPKYNSPKGSVLSSDGSAYSEFSQEITDSSVDQSQQTEPWSDSDYESDDDEAVSYEKKPARQYLQEMKELDNNKNLKGALALYSEMKQNKVFPQKYIYTFLIGACGRAGYTRAAFKLFKEMRDRHMEPSSATLTGLFNSCAETPFPKKGLEKAHELRNKMIENTWLPSTITYNAMIKAFGKCGDLKTAFQIVDEMAEARHALTSETFSFLLMSCVSDKEAGFTHAVQVFRKMRKLRITFTVYHYNLLLRAVRECGTGPPEISSQLMFDWYRQPKHKRLGTMEVDNATLQISGSSHKVDKYVENSVEKETQNTQISESSDSNSGELISLKNNTDNQLLSLPKSPPNLLATHLDLSNEVIGIGNINTANDRLLLIGGMDGVLSSMASEKIKPNIKTVTLMLDCIPSTCDAEQNLLSSLTKYKIKPDIDFFNLIIKRRNIRKEYTAALEILKLLPQHGISVDIATYGVLALGCTTRGLANKLINDMKDAGIQPNIEIIGALVSNAAARKDYRYIIDMMNITKELGIKPDPVMLEDLEKARKRANKLLDNKDPNMYVKPETLKWCRIFCMQYKPWLQSIEVEIPHHPWKQFRVSDDKIL